MTMTAEAATGGVVESLADVSGAGRYELVLEWVLDAPRERSTGRGRSQSW